MLLTPGLIEGAEARYRECKVGPHARTKAIAEDGNRAHALPPLKRKTIYRELLSSTPMPRPPPMRWSGLSPATT
jgi:hypothetical protein